MMRMHIGGVGVSEGIIRDEAESLEYQHERLADILRAGFVSAELRGELAGTLARIEARLAELRCAAGAPALPNRLAA